VRKGKNSRISDSDGANGATTEQTTLGFHARGGGTLGFFAEVGRAVRAQALRGHLKPVPAAHPRLADPVREGITEESRP